MQLFAGARRNWKFVVSFIVVSILFWLVQVGYQYYWVHPGVLEDALISGSAFAGTTYIALALFSSVLFKWKPKWNKYWPIRRSLGVLGTVFILMHSNFVVGFRFAGDPGAIYYELNPFLNPLIFGVLGLWIFALVALVSTDWAMQKLTAPRWKKVQYLVYPAFYLAVFHFATINPVALQTLPGVVLILLTAATLLGQLYWFNHAAAQKKFRGWGVGLGILLILLYLYMIYYLFL